jgi:hypothetical protein
MVRPFLSFESLVTRSKRLRFIVELTPLPGVNPMLALRQLLKIAGRQLGLKCTKIHVAEKEKRP